MGWAMKNAPWEWDGEVLFWIGVGFVFLSWKEITFDTVRIPNADLNVVLFVNPAAGIEFCTFCENTLHSVK